MHINEYIDTYHLSVVGTYAGHVQPYDWIHPALVDDFEDGRQPGPFDLYANSTRTLLVSIHTTARRYKIVATAPKVVASEWLSTAEAVPEAYCFSLLS